jgi:sentrin-specific protease 1
MMSVIDMRKKTIHYYDSLGNQNRQVLNALKEYLQAESMDKKKVPFDPTDWTMECVDCPQQTNNCDCGVFACQFAEFVSRDSPISFDQQHMPYFRRKMIYEIATGEIFLKYKLYKKSYEEYFVFF